tara:strand:- start:364 stop:831 length:468 start_codon:yes stop_codon:yes gene_type:complete
MFYALDICIIQNCVNENCLHLNGKNCVFLHKNKSNYFVICSDEKNMRVFKIKNNNLILDKNKNIEYIPGGSIRSIETRSSSIPINIVDRVKNCKKYFKLHPESMIIYDSNNTLQIAIRKGIFANSVISCWNDKDKIFNLYNVKILFKRLVLNLFI